MGQIGAENVKPMVAIIDYGAGNLCSVANAITRLGCSPKVTSNPHDVLYATAVILPGVGAAPAAMDKLKQLGMDEVIHELVCEGRPLFAVCIGLQVLFFDTEEGGGRRCLGIIPGVVRKLPSGLKVPHMGWNQVKQRLVHPIFEGIPDEANFYFVHSYYADPEDTSLVAGTVDYGVCMCAVLARGNLVATQFHPEKSGSMGLRMYSNFLRMAQAR